MVQFWGKAFAGVGTLHRAPGLMWRPQWFTASVLVLMPRQRTVTYGGWIPNRCGHCSHCIELTEDDPS